MNEESHALCRALLIVRTMAARAAVAAVATSRTPSEKVHEVTVFRRVTAYQTLRSTVKSVPNCKIGVPNSRSDPLTKLKMRP